MTTTGYLVTRAQSSPACQDAAMVLAVWLEQLDTLDYTDFTSGPATISVGHHEAWDRSESGRLLRWLADQIIDPEGRLAPNVAYAYAMGAVLLLEAIGVIRVYRLFRNESERHNFVVSIRLVQTDRDYAG